MADTCYIVTETSAPIVYCVLNFSTRPTGGPKLALQTEYILHACYLIKQKSKVESENSEASTATSNIDLLSLRKTQVLFVFDTCPHAAEHMQCIHHMCPPIRIGCK